jgi:hypothetical protein
MKMIPTTGADLEKIKARAKVLKRQRNIKHREALEVAAREAKYLHWHHAQESRKASEVRALTGALDFIIESLVKDALKGETHYVFDHVPAPIVMLANGSMDSVALDPKSDQAVLLTSGGAVMPWKADATSISWSAKYRLSESGLHVTPASGPEVLVPVDRKRLDECVAEALLPAPEVHVHDMDDPDSQALFRQMFEGEGLEELTPDVAGELLANGWEQSDIDQAIAAGAMYSRPRKSLVYPGGSSEDDEDLAA